MKIGITERGDASRDFSWVEKLNDVDGAILITKNVTDQFVEAVLPHKNKIIVHATVTGYGHTKLEHHVMSWEKSISQIRRLIGEGFPVEHIVLRIDPIIPTSKGLVLFDDVFRAGYAIGLRRFRISVIDMYPHVRSRFEENNLPLPYGDNFTASPEQFAMVDNLVRSMQIAYPYARIECCAEPHLNGPIRIGCISNYDLGVLGIQPETAKDSGHQRHGCLCLSCKTELLDNKYRCPNGCLYCYWRDKE